MRKLIFLFTIVLIIASARDLKAQDPHFSQYYAAPIYLNPALTGTSDGSYRLSTVYRDQWRSALDSPLRTFSVNADTKFEMSYNKQYTPDIIGVGINFFSDKVDFLDLNTNSISISGSYHKSLDKKSKQYLGIGLSIGVTQKNINYNNLTFEDQFNQTNGYTLPTGEVLPPNNFGFADFSLGLNYTVSSNSTNRFFIGGAFHHFLTPNLSFYNRQIDPDPNVIQINEYNSKISAYVNTRFQLSEEIIVHPRLLVLKQGDDLELNLSSNVSFPLGFNKNFYLGLGVRALNNIDGVKPSAIIPLAGIQIGDFVVGVSYDVNLLDISRDPAGLNSFEISISFLGNYSNEIDLCPTF